jgi:hypothetical protein
MRVMWRRPMRLLAPLVLSSGLVAPAAMQTRSRTDADVEAWLAAVRAHRPGTLDEHARALAISPWEVVRPVLGKVKDKEDPATLLRAAMLYLDLAVHIPREERPAYPTEGRVLRLQDGTSTGVSSPDSQIWWGRKLVDTVLSRGGLDPVQLETARRWYQVTSAILAGRLELADQHWHLGSARARFPDDPVLMLDAGCLAESLGSPMIQQGTADYEERSRSQPSGRVRSAVLPADAYRREAEELFRRSLAAGPVGEARVRLGWLLVQRNRIDEAIPLLDAANRDADDTVRYFASLFLAYARSQRAQWEPAVQAYRAALELFPEAQVPHLGLSLIEARRGAIAAARGGLTASLERKPLPRNDFADPWWRYMWCRGRDAERMHLELARDIAEAGR